MAFTLTFTGSSESSGNANEMITLEVEYLDGGSPVVGANVTFHWVSGDFHGLDDETFVYDNGTNAVTDAGGKATAFMKLVNIGSTLIKASVTGLDSSNETITIIDDDTEVYITGFRYQGSAWQTDINATFDFFDEVFRDVANHTYFDLAISHIEIIDSNSNTSNDAIVFMKRATYNGDIYLSDTDSASLRTALINKMNTESDITFTDVEVRSSRKEKI